MRIVAALSQHFRRADEPVTVLGWSLGGTVALRWAQQRTGPRCAARARLRDAALCHRCDGLAACNGADTLARFGDELGAAYRLTLQRFLTLQVQGSDEGRATLACIARAAVRARRARAGDAGRGARRSSRTIDLRADVHDDLGADARRQRRARCADAAGRRGVARACDARVRGTSTSPAPRTRHSCRIARRSTRPSRSFSMPAEPKFAAPDPRDVDPRAVRRAFGRARRRRTTPPRSCSAKSARGWRRVSTYVKLAPTRDSRRRLRNGRGDRRALPIRYPGARVVALDLALPMVAAARARVRRGRSLLRRLCPRRAGPAHAPWFVCGDVNALPLPRGRVRSRLEQPACCSGSTTCRARSRELRRVLKVGGLLTFTTFGPDTLREMRSAFARADGHTHTNRFVRHARPG